MSNISLIWVGFSAGLEMGLEELRESRPTAAKQVLRRYSSCEEEQSTGGGEGAGVTPLSFLLLLWNLNHVGLYGENRS